MSLTVESKHADHRLTRDNDWLICFHDVPDSGQSIIVEHIPGNYPQTTIFILSNREAHDQLRDAKRIAFEEVSV